MIGRVAHTIEERSSLRQPGAIMFVSCYELGHQPLGIAQPMDFSSKPGLRRSVSISRWRTSMNRPPACAICRISVPMHTALRLGVRVAELIGR